MASCTEMRMRSNTEGVCGNNAVQFQFCVGSSYCTALGENGCTDIVSRQLRDFSMVRRWCRQCARPSLVTPELMENVRQAVLQNWCFRISELSGQFPQMSRSLLHEIGEVQVAEISWLQTLAVDSYDTCIQTLVLRYDVHRFVEQVVACALVTQRARVRSPVGTGFLGEVFSGFFLTCKTNVGKL